jgi:putative ABC transport system permease protein
MRFTDIATAASRGVARRPLRAALTLVGLVIGVASTLLVVAVAGGASRSAAANIAGLGPNLVVVFPTGTSQSGVQSGFGTSSITDADVQALSDPSTIPNSVQAVPTTGLNTDVASLNRSWRTDVIGTTSGFATVRGYTVAGGRFFNDAEVQTGSSVAVVGQTLVDNLFAGSDPVGRIIRINTHPFQVVGVFAGRGYSGTFNQDDLVTLPITAVRAYVLPATAPTVQQVLLEASSTSTTGMVKDEATATLLQRHLIADPTKADFQVKTQQDLVAGANRVSHVLRWMLVVVALVSLTTGALAIASLMMATVGERRYEIGIRRAVGARRGEILVQFLAEALLLAIAGGALGIVIAVGAAGVIGSIVSDLPTPVVSVTAVLIAAAVAIVVGLVSGAFAAFRAADLEPADAVRRL